MKKIATKSLAVFAFVLLSYVSYSQGPATNCGAPLGGNIVHTAEPSATQTASASNTNLPFGSFYNYIGGGISSPPFGAPFGCGDPFNVITQSVILTSQSVGFVDGTFEEYDEFSFSGTTLNYPEFPTQSTYRFNVEQCKTYDVEYTATGKVSIIGGGCASLAYDRSMSEGYLLQMTVDYNVNPGISGAGLELDNYCNGSQGLALLSVKSPQAGSTYRLRAANNVNTVVATTTSGDFNLNTSQINALWDAASSRYEFVVTERRSYEYEEIIAAPVVNYSPVSTVNPIIDGEFNICNSTTTQTYSISNGSYETYDWDVTGGTINGPDTNPTVNVTWDIDAASGTITVETTREATQLSGAAFSCVTNDSDGITIEKYGVYNLSGTTEVCVGETGSVTLSGSDNGIIYRLFRNGSGVSGSDQAGSGSTLTWSNLSVGDTYTVETIITGCNNIEMNNSVDIENYAVKARPVIAGLKEVCEGSTLNLTGTTPNSTTGWEWYADYGSGDALVVGQTTANFSLTNTSNLESITAYYYDENGCISNGRSENIEVVEITDPNPSGENDICVGDYSQSYDAGVSADSYLWIVNDGGVISGSNSNRTVTVVWNSSDATGQLSVSAIYESTTNSLSCNSSTITYDVVIRDDINFYTLTGTENVCDSEKGSVTLSDSDPSLNYVLYINGSRSGLGSHAKIGTGSALTWDNLDVDRTYTVELETLDCGNYEMDGSVYVNEYAKSSAPTVTSLLEVCEGSATYNISFVGPTNLDEFIIYDDGGVELGRDNASSGAGSFAVPVTSTDTDFRVSYIDVNGCESDQEFFSVEYVEPPVPSISGDDDICVGAEDGNEYDAGVNADAYSWDVTGGTIIGGNTSRTVTVNWTPGATNTKVSVVVTEDSSTGSISCDSDEVEYNVVVRDDINFYDLTGTENVCFGEVGNVELSDSDIGLTYVLYINGSRSTNPSDAKIGNGSPLSWTGLDVNDTYTVRLETVDCGIFEMNGSVFVNEYSLPAKPTVVTIREVCAGSATYDFTFSGPSNLDEFIIYDDSGVELGRENGVSGSGTYPLPVSASDQDFQVSYIDVNGCESAIESFSVEYVIPPTPVVTGSNDICEGSENGNVYDAGVSADSYFWTVTDGTIIGGNTSRTVTINWDAGNANQSVSVIAREESTSGSTICNSATISYAVTVREDINFYTVSGTENLCEGELGSITLSDSDIGLAYVLYIDGSRSTDGADARTGTGSAITWDNLDVNTTYTVFMETVDCGNYLMDGSVFVNEYPKSAKPTVASLQEVCEGQTTYNFTFTGTSNLQEFIIYNGVGVELGRENGSGGIGTYALPVSASSTDFQVSYIDVNGCESNIEAFSVEYVEPPVPVITGTIDVCQGSENGNVYDAGVTADSYLWSVNGGTIIGSSTNRTVTINWTPAATNAKVFVVATIESSTGSISCDSDQSELDVTIRDDINFYTLTGTENVCDSELGSVTLSDTDLGLNYVLYINGTRSTSGSDARTGTGSAITWNDLAVGNTYTVFMETVDCGNYLMGGSVFVNEYPKSGKPTVTTLLEVCEGQTTYNFSFTGASNLQEFIVYDGTGSELGRVTGSLGNGTYPLPVTASNTDFQVSYIDVNGCESDVESFSVEFVDPPSPVITGNVEICVGAENGNVYDAGVTADEYLWSVNGGTIIGGSTSRTVTINWNSGVVGAKVFVIASVDSGSGSITCDSEQSELSVDVRSDVNFYSLSGTENVCSGETGSVTLSSSDIGLNYVLYIDGARSTDGADARTGTGSALSWTSLDANKSYAVFLETVDCGDFQMGSAVFVNEYLKSVAPNVSTLNEVCAGEVGYSFNFSGPSNLIEFIIYDNIGSEIGRTNGFSGSGSFSLPVTASDTDFSVSYIDVNGCESNLESFSVEYVIPPTPIITGLDEVCVGAENGNVYDAGVVADSYSWSVTGGTIIGSSTNRTVTVNWNEGASGARVSVIASFQSTSGLTVCPSDEVDYGVTVRNDITQYTLTGTENVCFGETGSVVLSSSEVGSVYVLYIDGERSTSGADAKSGTGSALTWSNLEVNKTYSVQLETVDCGNFLMNGSVFVNEYLKSIKPNVTTIREVCAGQPTYNFSFTGSGDLQEFIIYNSLGGEIGRVSGVFGTGSFQLPVTASNTDFSVSYIDVNGCESDIEMFSVEYVIPDTPVISGSNDICEGSEDGNVYDAGIDADAYSWSVNGGVIVGSSTNRAVNINWNAGAVGASVSVIASFESSTGSITCSSDQVQYGVTVRSDITFFSITGTENVCEGEKGNIVLSGSEVGSVYVLYIDDVRSTSGADAKSGTGSALAWTDLDVGSTYTVELETADCGNFRMNGSIFVNEYPKSVKPNVTTLKEVCAGEVAYNFSFSGPSDLDEFIMYDNLGSEIGRFNGVSGTGSFLLPVSAANQDFQVSYIDGNGCESNVEAFSVEFLQPETPSISGDSDICVGAENGNIYDAGVDADSYLWSVTGGTISGSSNNRTVSVNWNAGASGAKVSVVATFDSSTGFISCDSEEAEYFVNIRDDISFHTLSGTENVCNGELGSVVLSDSDIGLNYVLYINGVRSTDGSDARIGTGSAITWSNLAVNNSYAVFLETVDCGDYQMGSSVFVNEFAKSVKPTVTTLREVCEGSTTYDFEFAGASNLIEFIVYDRFGFELGRVSGNSGRATYPLPVSSSSTDFEVSYIDANGCESNIESFSVEFVSPVTPIISGNNEVCQGSENGNIYDAGVTADSYFWSVTGGTIVGSSNNRNVTVNWFAGATNAKVSVIASTESTTGSLSCDSDLVEYNVIVLDNVNFYSLSGTDNVCFGELGSVELSDSDVGLTYVLYIDASRSSLGSHAKTGTGSALTWDDLDPNSDYTVFLETSDCGVFQMSNTVSINEYSKSAKPTVSTLREVCDGESSYDFTFTGASDLIEFIIYDNSGVELGRTNGSSGSGVYDLPVTESNVDFQVSYIDGNGCESDIESFSIEYVIPPTPVISGNSDVCQGTEDGNVYDAGVSADAYAWSVTGGTIVGSSSERQITIDWDEGATNAEVSVIVSTESSTGSTTCDSDRVAFDVDVRSDIIEFSVSATENVCSGETGSLTLNGTEIGEVYVLYIDGVRSDNDARTGIGSAITWTGLEVDRNYEVYLETAECGIYQMGSALTITEYPVSTKPSVVTLLEVCGEGLYDFTFEGQTGAQEFYLFNQFNFPIASANASGDRTTISINVFEGNSAFKVNYLDANGCISATTDFVVELVDTPVTDGIIGNKDICQGAESGNEYDAGVVADSYLWNVTGGTIIGGSTNKTVTVDWDVAATNASIEMTAFSESSTGTITCESEVVTADITIRNDIFLFDLVQSDFACELSTGSVSISGSQVGMIYVLYINGNRSFNSDHAKIGTGSQIEWSGLDPFLTYTVNLETVECGNYQMNNEVILDPENAEDDGVDLEVDELITTSPANVVTSGEPIIFETPVEAESYHWQFTGGIESFKERPAVVFNMPDTTINVTLTLTFGTGCSVTYDVNGVVRVEDTNGKFAIPEPEENRGIDVSVNGTVASLYPVPTEGSVVNLKMTSIRSELLQVTVSDLSKRNVSELTLQVTEGENDLEIPLSIPSGYYFIIVKGSQFTKPLILTGLKK